MVRRIMKRKLKTATVNKPFHQYQQSEQPPLNHLSSRITEHRIPQHMTLNPGSCLEQAQKSGDVIPGNGIPNPLFKNFFSYLFTVLLPCVIYIFPRT
jgi:hypothetical protein